MLIQAQRRASLLSDRGAATQQRTQSHTYSPWAASKAILNALLYIKRSQDQIVSLTPSEDSGSNFSEYFIPFKQEPFPVMPHTWLQL